MGARLLLATLAGIVATGSLLAAELEPRAAEAFDRYVRATEVRLQRESFLRLDGLPAPRRTGTIRLVHNGGLWIDAVRTLDGGRGIDVPGGLIHHWAGTAFVPGATLDEAVTILQDYDRHERIYAPVVERSRVLSRDGGRFRFFLRFRMTRLIEVVIDSEHDARFMRDDDRAEAWIHSTRIAEVENAGLPDERETPVGKGGGYLWRLSTYWRLLARDGGLYIQCESVSLSRGIPAGLGWLVGPFVTSIPKESLTFTLETTRKRLLRMRGRSPKPPGN